MGFRLNVKGQGEEILLEKESILDVKLKLKEKFWQLQMEMLKMIQERLLNGH